MIRIDSARKLSRVWLAGMLAASAALLALAPAALASSVSGVTVSPSTNVAGQGASYAAEFTATHAISAAGSDWIQLDASTGAQGTAFTAPATIFNPGYGLVDHTTSTAYGLSFASIGFSSGNQVVRVNLAGTTVAINAGDDVTLTVPATNLTLAGPLNSLLVSTSQDTTGVTSPTFAIVPAAPAQVLRHAGNGQSAEVGTAFGAPLAAEVVDQYGNGVPGETVSFSAPADGASGTFAATGDNTDSAVTDAAGVATSSAFTAGTEAGSYQVQASDGAPSLNYSLTNEPGAPASVTLQLAVPEIPADGISSTTATAMVLDALGNPIPWESVSIASSDPDQPVGPTVPHADGTYTATVGSSVTPRSSSITATDTSPDPDIASPPADLTQTALPPSAATSAATGVGASAATLGGVVNPHSLATTYHFEYGTDTKYGHVTAPAGAGNGAADKAVSAALTGLAPGTTYHYRVVASNSAGTTSGPDVTFTTASVSAPPPGGGAAAAPRLGLLTRPKSKGSRVTVKLACAAAPCTGLIRLRAGRRTLASRKFSIRAGDEASVTLRLSRSARKLLARRGRLKATLTVSLNGGAPSPALSQGVTLRAPKARRHR